MDIYYAATCQVDHPNPMNREQMDSNTDRMLEMT